MFRAYKNLTNSGISWWGAIMLLLGMVVVAPFVYIKAFFKGEL